MASLRAARARATYDVQPRAAQLEAPSVQDPAEAVTAVHRWTPAELEQIERNQEVALRDRVLAYDPLRR